MKKGITSVAFLAVLLFSGYLAQAKHRSGGKAGIHGTVTEVAKQYFMMDLDKGGYLKVAVSLNTHFELNGKPSDASHVKKGAQVRIAGTTTDGSLVEALLVNVTREGTSEK